jgi:hypothetical protein
MRTLEQYLRECLQNKSIVFEVLAEINHNGDVEIGIDNGDGYGLTFVVRENILSGVDDND